MEGFLSGIVNIYNWKSYGQLDWLNSIIKIVKIFAAGLEYNHYMFAGYSHFEKDVSQGTGIRQHHLKPALPEATFPTTYHEAPQGRKWTRINKVTHRLAQPSHWIPE